MATVTVTSDGFFLQGSVGFENVVALREQGERLIAARQSVTIDLAKLHEEDASLFSLLLCWQRFAKQKTCALTFSNATTAIHRMAELFSLTDMLKI